MPPEKTGGGSPKLRSHGRRIELEIEPLHVIADTSGKAASVLTHPAITWQLGTDVAGVGLPKKPLGRREHRLGAVELQQQCRFVTRPQRGEPGPDALFAPAPTTPGPGAITQPPLP